MNNQQHSYSKAPAATAAAAVLTHSMCAMLCSNISGRAIGSKKPARSICCRYGLQRQQQRLQQRQEMTQVVAASKCSKKQQQQGAAADSHTNLHTAAAAAVLTCSCSCLQECQAQSSWKKKISIFVYSWPSHSVADISKGIIGVRRA
jgi:hypothetical protein